MKVASISTMADGLMMPDAFLSFGKWKGDGWYLSLAFPLFVLMWQRELYARRNVFGWYVPRIAVRRSLFGLEVRWWWDFHSDFMGERQEEGLRW